MVPPVDTVGIIKIAAALLLSVIIVITTSKAAPVVEEAECYKPKGSSTMLKCVITYFVNF